MRESEISNLKFRIALACLACVAVVALTEQTTMIGTIYFTASPTPGGDFLSVWAAGSTPTPNCQASPNCYFAVQSNGNLYFSGNNATYGAPDQTTQSYIRFYGGSIEGAANGAPAYLQFLTYTGSIATSLFASTTVPGELCEGSSIPGGDCAPGSQLVTQAQMPALTPQAANLVYAGPASGTDAVPSFRALTSADLPATTAGVTSEPVTYWSFGNIGGTLSPAANVQHLFGFILDPAGGVEAGAVIVDVAAADTTPGGDEYSFAFYSNCSGSPVAYTAPQTMATVGPQTLPFQTTVTLSPGPYCIGMTGSGASTARFGVTTNMLCPFYVANAGKTYGGASISISAQPLTWSAHQVPTFALVPAVAGRRRPPRRHRKGRNEQP
jgi:hypothetical protein